MTESVDAQDVTITKVSDIEKTPAGKVRRWLAEISLADEREEKWRKEGKDVNDLYDAKETKANSFNILWSNTETLRPAIYNSTPEPDVRRRFRDADPVGKVASTVLERSLSYQIDDYDFDAEIKDVVLDALLPGRGLARIVYEPHFGQVTPEGIQPARPAGFYQEPTAEESESAPGDNGGEQPAPYEKIIGQDARCAHVQWDKFRHGPGKRWPDVPWVSFEHEFTQEMCEEKFGPEIAKKLEYAEGANCDKVDRNTKEIFKVAKVYEIWDKDERRTLFIAPTFKDQPCLELDDPLRLRQFFPLPRPVYAIENSRSLIPTPLYRMYQQQAKELDRISARINKIAAALKVRGAHSAHIPEAAEILKAGDEEMVAIQNPSLIAEHGGLDKLIWILPLDKLAGALRYLYEARDQIKQAIYEITGVADVIRGATNPNETLGAQKLKSQWGSLRIQKLQKEVQRFIRDLLRLKAEVIAEHFTAEQLQAMTNIQLPDAQAKQQAQMAAQQAQMQQQPPPPEALKVLSQPTWDDVIQLLRSDQMRQYRVDIETDSTVADTVMQDMDGFNEAVRGVGEILSGATPAIQSGMLPVDAVKEICLAFSRRARLGSALEDALEQIKAPAPPQAEQAPPDHSLEVAKIQAESKAQIAQMQEQTKQQISAMKEQAETQRAQMKAESDAQVEAMNQQMSAMSERQKVELEAAVKVICAQISATKSAAEPGTAANANREFAQDVVQ